MYDRVWKSVISYSYFTYFQQPYVSYGSGNDKKTSCVSNLFIICLKDRPLPAVKGKSVFFCRKGVPLVDGKCITGYLFC